MKNSEERGPALDWSAVVVDSGDTKQEVLPT
jgi:hypothetical protein